MKKEMSVPHRSKILFPAILVLLFMVGILVSVIQNQQTVRTRAATPDQCAVTSTQMTISTAEGALFDSINAYREQQGFPILTWSTALKKPTAWMSADMLANNNLSHTDSLGRNLITRLAACGATTTTTVAENIDSGTTSPQTLMESWKHAPNQNTNLLNPQFMFGAVSLASDPSTNKAFWVVTFSGAFPTPSPSPTLQPTATTVPTSILTPSKTPTVTQAVSPTKPPTVTQTKKPTKTPTQAPTKQPSPTQIPTPTVDPSFVSNPDDTQLGVSVHILGIGTDGNKSPKHLSRKVQIDVYDLKNKIVLDGTGFLRYENGVFNGIVHLGKIPNGTYYLKIFSAGTLQTTVQPIFQPLANTKLNILPEVTLIQGDLELDNFLTIEDFNLALLCFQDPKCETKEAIDFNDDGKADVTDYNLLLQNFWKYQGD